MATIEYFFTVASPWAYLGHDAVHAVAKRRGATLVPKPMALGNVFPETGGVPLKQRHPARRSYRMIELQRWREFRRVELTLRPTYFPADPALIDRAILAALTDGHDVRDLTLHAFRAIWVENRDIGDPDTIRAILSSAGLDGASLLRRAETPEIGALYDDNARAAVSYGVVGSPGYVLDGEPFWGQDRIELLEAALVSGRSGYRADATE